MTVRERFALMGPNLYASAPCVQWTIDLGEMEERPSNAIDGFVGGLQSLMPSLVEHRCSEGHRGGFFVRLAEGTWMGHVMEHIALELQVLVGADVGFGRTRSTGSPGVYNVIYECEERETGIEAGRLALEILEALIAGETYDVEGAISSLRELRQRRTLGPSTGAIVQAAAARDIPHVRLDERSLVQLGWGANSRKIQATTSSNTRYLGVEIAGDKDLTKSLLGFHGVPVPRGHLARSVERAIEIAESIGWPVVVKPLDASHGRGIITDIRNEADLRRAYDEARQFRSTIIVERFIKGNDYRLLVVNYKLVAAAQRIPARVTGDGTHTIRELVEIENSDPRRGVGHQKILTRITIDEMTEHLLALRGLTPESVPAAGDRVYLKTTANLSTGGFAVDVTDKVHPANIHLAERIARLIDLDIAGIDVVSPAIDQPIAEVGGGIVEVNAAPGFRMHVAPTEGKPRPVAEAVIDMLFPPGSSGRIPLIAVTGTNGKTTTARLCAHIAKQAGNQVGLTTTEGIYINNELIVKGDCSGPDSARVVLRDPSVTFGVLETARGGMLRAGLAYDWSDVAIVTNVSNDHLGLRGVDTLEDLALVKAIPVERVRSDGYAVLNAEDAMTPLIREHASGRIALFSLDPDIPQFRDHVDGGGVGASVENGHIVLWANNVRIELADLSRVPLTFGGRARFNVANTLAAVTASYCVGLDVEDIGIAIQTFFPSIAQTPGRMNVFEIRDFHVVLDYAHNPDGFRAVAEFARASRRNRLIAILGIPGDRRDEDIREAALVAAHSFDIIVVREDFKRRGRDRGEVSELLRSAILEAGFDEGNLRVRADELEAVQLALDTAERDDLVLYFADDVDLAIRMLDDYRQGGDVSADWADTGKRG